MIIIFENSCTEFYKHDIYSMWFEAFKETVTVVHYISFIFYSIFMFALIFSSLRLILENRFLPHLAYKISLKNMSILAPNSGCVSMSYLFIGLALLFPIAIPCLLLLHFLKVFLVWIYLTIKYRQIATKELEEFEARAKRKRKDV